MNTLHPTVLIGYGSYGLKVLQDLLSAASARGSLVWDEAEAPGASSDGERRLAVLAPFWIPDVLDLEDDARKHLRTSDSFEMMLDLYEQIVTVQAGADILAQVLTERVEAAKRRLFKQDRMQSDRSAVTLGLDVIVLARPAHETVIGKLRELLQPVMQRLSEDPGLTAPRAGQELLNFIQILDFEDFWSPAPHARAVREALVRALAGTEQALASGHAAFGRVYLFDGRTEQGNQDEKRRIHQVILFLEFLLFESKRSTAEFRHLFQREHPGASPLCFAGVRAVEFSNDRLRRLAAANFGRGWLNYMLGPGSPGGSDERLDKELLPFAPGQLDRTLDLASIDLSLSQAIGEIEQELLALDPRDKDWPHLIETRSQKLVADWRRQLMAGAIQQLSQQWLIEMSGLRKRLIAAISRALTDQHTPVTLGAVLAAVRQWQTRLAPETSDESEAPAQEPASPELAKSQAAYLQTEEELVALARLQRWWPLFAMGAAAIFLPIALGAVEALFLSHPEPRLLVDGAMAAALIAFFGLAGAKTFHPLVARSVTRTRDFYVHPDRGRLADAIRSHVASDRIQGELRRATGAAKETLRKRILGEIQTALQDILTRLEMRRSEMQWLSRQLGDYLALQGVDTSKTDLSFLSNHAAGEIRKNVENDQDLHIVAEQLSRDSGRFKDVQRKLAIFEHWHDPFHNLLLNPHQFLDQLSQFYVIADWQTDGPVANRRQNEIVSAIKALGKFPVSFYWRRTDGLPEPVFLCSVPAQWLRLPDIYQKLAEIGYLGAIQQSPDAERIYLLQTRANVPGALLTI